MRFATLITRWSWCPSWGLSNVPLVCLLFPRDLEKPCCSRFSHRSLVMSPPKPSHNCSSDQVRASVTRDKYRHIEAERSTKSAEPCFVLLKNLGSNKTKEVPGKTSGKERVTKTKPSPRWNSFFQSEVWCLRVAGNSHTICFSNCWKFAGQLSLVFSTFCHQFRLPKTFWQSDKTKITMHGERNFSAPASGIKKIFDPFPKKLAVPGHVTRYDWSMIWSWCSM